MIWFIIFMSVITTASLALELYNRNEKKLALAVLLAGCFCIYIAISLI